MEDLSTMEGRIAARRKSLGLSQADVAEKMMIKRETYNTIENGKRSLKDQEIVALAKVLEVSTDYILQGVETEYLDIAAATGLSNDSISALHGFYERAHGNCSFEDRDVLEAINLFLSNSKGISLLVNISKYLRCKFDRVYQSYLSDEIFKAISGWGIIEDSQIPTDKVCIATDERNWDANSISMIRLSSEMLAQAVLKTISDDISSWRKEIQESRAQEKEDQE